MRYPLISFALIIFISAFQYFLHRHIKSNEAGKNPRFQHLYIMQLVMGCLRCTFITFSLMDMSYLKFALFDHITQLSAENLPTGGFGDTFYKFHTSTQLLEVGSSL